MLRKLQNGKVKKLKKSTVFVFLTALQTRSYVLIILCGESILLLLSGRFEYNGIFVEKDSIG